MVQNNSTEKKNYILVGLGPFAKKYYYDMFIKDFFDIELLVELDIYKNAVLEYTSNFSQKPDNYYFCPSSQKDNEKLDKQTEKYLNNFLKENKVDGIIIATEPKSHFAYLNWAIKNNLKILVDKPPIALSGLVSDENTAENYYKKIQKLLELNRKHPTAKISVCSQRRYHEGFIFVKNLLKDFVRNFGIPISNISVNHCDGMWNMPNEFAERENHPYKYGYGKLMHSGYHFVDTMNWLLEANYNSGKNIDSINVFSSGFFPTDFQYHIQNKDYKNLFGDEIIYKDYVFEGFGEIDTTTIIEFLNKDKKLVTTGVLNLLQNGFSRRESHILPEDTYKSNGRLRHEYWNIQVGPLLNIQIHSYKSFDKNNFSECQNFENNYSIGANNHFDVYIFRNSSLVGGKPFEKIEFGKNYGKLMGNARKNLVKDFINDGNTYSMIQGHELTSNLISNMYISLAKRKNSKNPFVKNIKIKPKVEKYRKRGIAIIFNSQGKVLVGKFNGTGVNGKENYTFPTGGIRENQKYMDEIYREIYEEFGIQKKYLFKIHEYEFFYKFFDNEKASWINKKKGEFYSGNKNRIYLFYFSGNENNIKTEMSDEIKIYKWISPEELENYIKQKEYLEFINISDLKNKIQNYLSG